jgi:hypothetical protein
MVTAETLYNLGNIRRIPGTAVFSEDKKYRYILTREWNKGDNPIAFLMCNPSTADEKILDPTVYKCLEWSILWGYNKLIIVNFFAYRSTDVKQIYKISDPIGPKNDYYTKLVFEWCKANIESKVIVAAGTNGLYLNRYSAIKTLAKQVGINLYYMALTPKGKVPQHPLYLKKDLTPQLWREDAESINVQC